MNDDPRKPEDDEAVDFDELEVLDLDELLDDALSTGYRARGNGNQSGSVIDRLGESLSAVPDVQLRALAEHDCEVLGPVESLSGLDARYEIRGEIGRGGIGEVYQAHDCELRREVAIKVLHRELIDQPEHVSRFVEEAQIGGQLNHPSILPVHELGLWGERVPFFAMKLVSGDTLAVLLAERTSPAEDQRRFLGIFEQVCQAVAYAHSRGVVHRDLKPANVMVGRFGEVHVMDWGMAKVLDRNGGQRNTEGPVATVRTGPGSDASVAGSIMGTLAYLAPEQARGQVDRIDERTDVFCLGALLCEILTGLPPYVAADARALRKAARAADLSAAMARLESCGAEDELVELARRCLSPERSSRPHDAAELAESVASYLSGVEERAQEAHVAAALAGEKASSARRGQRFTLAIAGSLLLASLFAVGFLWIQGKQEAQLADRHTQIRALIAEGRRLQAQAAVAPIGNVDAWTEALSSLAPIQAAMEGIDVREDIRTGLAHLREDIDTGMASAMDAAETKARTRAMSQRLEGIAARLEDATGSFPRADLARTRIAEYEQAFAAYGLDLVERPVHSVAEEIAGTEIAVELAVALDDWAAARRKLDGEDSESGRRLQRIALEADRDPWRRRLRELLLEEEIDKTKLRAFMSQADPEELSPPSLVLLGRELWVGPRATPEAIQLLERAVLLHPSSFELAVELGLAHTHNWRNPGRSDNDWDAVLRAFSSARALRPESAGVVWQVSRALWQTGESDRALLLLEEDKQLRPTLPGSYYLAASIKLEGGDTAGAIEDGLRAVELGVQHGSGFLDHYHNDLGVAYSMAGMFPEAIAQLKMAVELDEDWYCPRMNLGDVLRQSGFLERALEECSEAVRLAPWEPDAHYNLAFVYRDMEDFPRAIESFRDSIGISEDSGTYCRLGDALWRNGEPQKAIDAYKNAILLDDEWFEPHMNMVDACVETRQFELAITHGKRAVELMGDATDARNNLAYAYLVAGHEESAIEEYERVILDHPEWALPRNNLGNLLLTRDDLEGAFEHLSAAVEYDPDLGHAWYNLARLYLRQGEYDKALSHVSKGYEFIGEHPSYPESLFREFASKGDRLDSILDQPGVTEDVDELLLAFRLGYITHRYAASADAGLAAFRADPSCADDLGEGNRYNAACSAALAAAGKGDEADELSPERRSELRMQALEWLREDLIAWQQLVAEDEQARPAAIQYLNWAMESDADLEAIRDPDSVEHLPDPEREACVALWQAFGQYLEELEEPR